MPGKVIQVINLHFKYSFGGEVIKGLNLEVEEGEILAIIGSNGAGKTTLIKHLNGLLKPTKGKVFIYGKDTEKHSVAELSKIVGLVFQNPDHQIFAETVEKEINFGLENLGLDERARNEVVDRILKEFELEVYRTTSPHSLSGGEKKKLTIASVVAMDPKILVLDEPTIGQDYLQRLKLVDLIKRLKNEGKTVLIVTHDLDFLMDIPCRVVVLHNGIKIAEGNREDILCQEEILNKASLLFPQLIEISTKVFGRPVWVNNVEDLGRKFINGVRG